LQVALALTIGETAATNLKRSKEALRQHGQMPKDSQAT
jgi:hypothetical protein